MKARTGHAHIDWRTMRGQCDRGSRPPRAAQRQSSSELDVQRLEVRGWGMETLRAQNLHRLEAHTVPMGGARVLRAPLALWQFLWRYRKEGARLRQAVNTSPLGVHERGVAGVGQCVVGLLLDALGPVCPDVGWSSMCLVPGEGPQTPLGSCLKAVAGTGVGSVGIHDNVGVVRGPDEKLHEEPARPAVVASCLVQACDLVVLVHGFMYLKQEAKLEYPRGRTFMQNFLKRSQGLTYLV